ncbi:alpha/beta hydrolase family protein [Streptosporangium sp. NPDC049248]|uniref:alpha/beta hydrolase n=1 Tax=Streptosporangium sp. NPDC049248 TaxID=3155651 RepID=UPI003439344C
MRPARRGLLALATALVVGFPSTAHAAPAWASAPGDRSGEAGAAVETAPEANSAGRAARKGKPAEGNTLVARPGGRTASAVRQAAKPQPSPSPSAGKGGKSPWGPWPAARPGAARVVKETWLGPRTLDLQISSPSVNATLPVRVLVPKGWSKGARRTWPVLYLLHGGADNYTSWTRMTGIASMTEDMDAIIVMPEAGRAGNYSNWYNKGKRGAPGWETFHTSEVRRLLETGYRAGSRRAVAGLSMGAYGAMKYAALHRGMFRFVGAYSGVMSTRLPGIPELIMNAQASEGQDPQALWGDPLRNRDVWKANDPAAHARNLRGVSIYISSGTTSRLGELDPPGAPWSPAHLGEPISAYTARDLVAKLRFHGIKPVVHLYKDGTHSWPYWEREFRSSFPMILSALGLKAAQDDASAPREQEDVWNLLGGT